MAARAAASAARAAARAAAALAARCPALRRPDNEDLVLLFDIGARSHNCSYCHAQLWDTEQGRGKMCCSKGKALPLQAIFSTPAPHPLQSLLRDPNYPGSKAFKTSIRTYNNSLSMASSGVQAAHPRNGISMLAVQGALHHFIGPLLPFGDGGPSKFAQLYIIDSDQQLEARLAQLGGGSAANAAAAAVQRQLMGDLQRAMLHNNTYVQQFRQAMDIPAADVAEYEIVIKVNGTVDKRRYNAPAAAELAGFMPGTDNELLDHARDVVVRARAGLDMSGLRRISDCHRAYDPLRFPLLYPHGEHGWHPDIVPRANSDDKKITAMMYSAYFMHDRPNDNCNICRAGRLYQEWLVDQYCKIESQRLLYIKLNQSSIRADLYQGVADAARAGDTTAAMQGRSVVLPSSFTGGPR
jgi:hypothetical protein